jgi:hypothetical protein
MIDIWVGLGAMGAIAFQLGLALRRIRELEEQMASIIEIQRVQWLRDQERDK